MEITTEEYKNRRTEEQHTVKRQTRASWIEFDVNNVKYKKIGLYRSGLNRLGQDCIGLDWVNRIRRNQGKKKKRIYFKSSSLSMFKNSFI